MRWVLICTVLMACGVEETTDSAVATCQLAVVTDIDATLTTSDSEFLSQLIDGTHDPAMRPEANQLFSDYAAIGYTVFYVTARGEDLTVSDGRTAREATADWLAEHGFPYAEEQLFLGPGVGVSGDDAVAYKSAVLTDALAGWDVAWAYGDKDSDTLAWQAAGVPDGQIWLVGELAGTMGVPGISDEDAYGAHRAAHMSTVADACP
jgi:phosphatidate phosphatase PAH1